MTGHSTHYLRFDMGKVARKSEDTFEFEQLMQIVRERKATSSAWAPHGYARMLKAVEEGDRQALKLAINTMRPSSLAEPEDLAELLVLLTAAKGETSPSASRREAIEYAEMVVRYVNDGSGTPDLIQKAIVRLQETKPQPDDSSRAVG